jgi:hypothetical protein
VDDDRQAQLARDSKLHPQDLALHVSRREGIVVIEADLADGPRGGHRGDGRSDDPRNLVLAARVLPRLMRMHPDCEPKIRPHADESRGTRRLLRVSRTQDAERAFHAAGAGARDHRISVVGKCGVRQMAMGINHE